MKRIAIILLFAACGSSGGSKTDLSKMSPDEACRTISKRAFECKDTIIPAVSDTLKKGGAPDDVIKQMTAQMQMPMACDHVDAQSLDQMRTCYDDDCGKLAQCYVGVAKEALMPSGPAPSPVPSAPAQAAPQPPPLTP